MPSAAQITKSWFFIVLLIYGGSVAIALSPVGEVILRLCENCREPLTQEEREYLLPLFEEVYENAKEIDPKLNHDIQLYIMDGVYVNAFAIGRKTIAVTRGAIATFTADELKGILAHELGHMTHGHTKALLLSVVGNFFFSIIVWMFRLLLYFLEVISNIVAHFNIVGVIFWLLTVATRFMADLSIFLFIELSQIILALNSRSNEIQADTYAYEVGYGVELISGLYVLQKISMNTNVKLSEKMKASHPHTAYRIAHLEKLENEDIPELEE